MTIAVPLEDRFALHDLLNAYCFAVDKLADVDGMLSLFTEDAVYDLTDIGMLRTEGHAGIRAFFEGVFSYMTHHAHYATNFAVQSYNGDTASIRGYVFAMGNSNDGNTVTVHVDYYLDCVRTATGWKIKRFYEKPLMPMPNSLTEIHGEG